MGNSLIWIVFIISLVLAFGCIVTLFCYVYKRWRADRRYKIMSAMHEEIETKVKESGDDRT